MWTQENRLLAATIALLAIALVVEWTHGSGATLATGIVLLVVVVVRIVVPGVRTLRDRDRAGPDEPER